MDALWHMSFPYWQFVIRAVIVYIAVIILIRLGGKRQIGQMGTGEFVAILLISNAVQNSMNGGDNSISGGLILGVVIILLSLAVAYLSYKSDRFEKVVQGNPTLLIRHGEVLHKNLTREMLNIHELKTMLRRQGVYTIDDVSIAILEGDGNLTIIRDTDPDHHPVDPVES